MANPPITVGELADVPAPGSSVASAFHVEIANRVVQRFATVAARDASFPAATAGKGAVCVTLDKVALWQSNGAQWVPVGAGGAVGSSANAGTQTTAGTTELVVLTSPVFNAPGGRRYRIAADFVISGSVAGDACRLAIRRGNSTAGTLIAYPAINNMAANQALPVTVLGYDATAPANPTQQYCLTLTRTGGTGTWTFNIGGGFSNNLVVEDIGPA